MAAPFKAEVPASAVIRRLNRQLERDGRSVRKARGVVAGQLGDYFLVTEDSVSRRNVDLEQIARKHGAPRSHLARIDLAKKRASKKFHRAVERILRLSNTPKASPASDRSAR